MYSYGAIKRFSPANARVLVAMVQLAGEGGVLRPDRVIAKELGIARQTVCTHKHRLGETGYLEVGYHRPSRLRDGFITESHEAAIAEFAWGVCYQKPWLGVSMGQMRQKLSSRFPRYTKNWRRHIDELIALGYLTVDEEGKLHHGERGRREIEYLKLLAQDFLRCWASFMESKSD